MIIRFEPKVKKKLMIHIEVSPDEKPNRDLYKAEYDDSITYGISQPNGIAAIRSLVKILEDAGEIIPGAVKVDTLTVGELEKKLGITSR